MNWPSFQNKESKMYVLQSVHQHLQDKHDKLTNLIKEYLTHPSADGKQPRRNELRAELQKLIE